jgi:hypothetical protein
MAGQFRWRVRAIGGLDEGKLRDEGLVLVRNTKILDAAVRKTSEAAHPIRKDRRCQPKVVQSAD